MFVRPVPAPRPPGLGRVHRSANRAAQDFSGRSWLWDAGHSGLRDIATSWAQLRAEDGEAIDTEIAEAIVGDLAGLASSARRQDHAVYCWVA